MDFTITTATKAMLVCKRLAVKIWGWKQGCMMYTIIIRPISTPCVSGMSLVTVGKELTKLQSLEPVCVTDAMFTCPISVLILELGPLHIVVEKPAKRTILALALYGHEKNEVITAQKQRIIEETLPMALLSRDDITKKIYFEKSFKISLGNKNDLQDSTSNE